MARLRPWRCYRQLERPYTRISRSKKYNYIPGAPPARIRYLIMGNTQKADWKYAASLISLEDLQIRDNALEAVRVMVNKYLETEIGQNNYLFMIKAYPHHVIRENPMVYGAGADRISKGMRLAFGRPKGRAAQVYRGKEILTIFFDDLSKWDDIKYYLKVAASKLPGSYSIKLIDLESKKEVFV